MIIRHVDVELTSKCNLKCPFCLHTTDNLEPKDLDLSVFNKINMGDIEHIDMCGNTGEPVCHPDFLKFVDMIADRTLVKISTNGSLHKEGWWKTLAEKLDRTRDSYVIFALDGLEKTHKKYRVGANYKQTLKNIEAYNKAGGISCVQLITFKHNINEVDEIETLIKSLGSEKLILRTSSIYNDVFERPDEKVKTRREACKTSDIAIVCKHLKQSGIFIDYEGEVFPCCFLSICKHSPNLDKKFYEVYQKYKDEINLNKHSLEEVMNSNFYQFLHTNYSELKRCQSFCKFEAKDFIKLV